MEQERRDDPEAEVEHDITIREHPGQLKDASADQPYPQAPGGVGDLLYLAWTIIANADTTPIDQRDDEWGHAARRFRHAFHAYLEEEKATKERELAGEGQEAPRQEIRAALRVVCAVSPEQPAGRAPDNPDILVQFEFGPLVQAIKVPEQQSEMLLDTMARTLRGQVEQNRRARLMANRQALLTPGNSPQDFVQALDQVARNRNFPHNGSTP